MRMPERHWNASGNESFISKDLKKTFIPEVLEVTGPLDRFHNSDSGGKELPSGTRIEEFVIEREPGSGCF